MYCAFDSSLLFGTDASIYLVSPKLSVSFRLSSISQSYPAHAVALHSQDHSHPVRRSAGHKLMRPLLGLVLGFFTIDEISALCLGKFVDFGAGKASEEFLCELV